MEENRTDSGTKIVPTSFTTERAVRAFLADALKFLRNRTAWPDVEGDLSDWIIEAHGLQGEKSGVDLNDVEIQEVLKSLDILCAALQGTSGTGPNQARRVSCIYV